MRACLSALPRCHFPPPSQSRAPGMGLLACSALWGAISWSLAQLACQPGYLSPAEAARNGPAVPGHLGICASWSRVTLRQLPRACAGGLGVTDGVRFLRVRGSGRDHEGISGWQGHSPWMEQGQSWPWVMEGTITENWPQCTAWPVLCCVLCPHHLIRCVAGT